MSKTTASAAGGAMPATASRRLFLGALAAAPALAVPAVVIAAQGDDPIFPVIAVYEAAVARANSLLSGTVAFGDAVDEECAAWRAMTETVPTTLAGVKALADHVAAHPDIWTFAAEDGSAQALESISAALDVLIEERANV
ncbi:hypothetical protein SAMN05519103_03945 [Rhizobiales bacterium GAS113]|nr:hypothetical protein SAMN05519103_03945 [Rhizobiales bacterium GAS113]